MKSSEPGKARPVRSRPIEIVAILGVLALGVWLWIDQTTILVRVENAGRGPMSDVAVVIAGTRWQVGRLEQGESRSKRFSLDTDSRVDVRYVEADGSTREKRTGPYLVPNSHGTLGLRIREDGVVEVESAVR